MSYFTVQTLFSVASRESCLNNLRKVQIPMKIIPKVHAAVLVPFCVYNEKVSILYTVRSKELRTHSGEISFPGGKNDEGETPVQTSLRETSEEIGLNKENVDIWGHGFSIPGKDYKVLITPVLATINNFDINNLTLNKSEVEELFIVSVEDLCNKKNHHTTQIKSRLIMPEFLVNSNRIWGVTALITDIILRCWLPSEVYSNEWRIRKPL